MIRCGMEGFGLGEDFITSILRVHVSCASTLLSYCSSLSSPLLP
jgi:hypothetical protein